MVRHLPPPTKRRAPAVLHRQALPSTPQCPASELVQAGPLAAAVVVVVVVVQHPPPQPRRRQRVGAHHRHPRATGNRKVASGGRRVVWGQREVASAVEVGGGRSTTTTLRMIHIYCAYGAKRALSCHEPVQCAPRSPATTAARLRQCCDSSHPPPPAAPPSLHSPSPQDCQLSPSVHARPRAQMPLHCTCQSRPQARARTHTARTLNKATQQLRTEDRRIHADTSPRFLAVSVGTVCGKGKLQQPHYGPLCRFWLLTSCSMHSAAHVLA